jgi:protein phosphatase 1G
MEDTHIASTSLPNDISIFGVFDGHGGSEMALFVQKHFIPTLLQNQAFLAQDFEPALYQTFLAMDELVQTKEGQQEIMKLMGEEESESMAGCTANVCIVTKEKIVCANSGDSRAVLKRKEVMGKYLEGKSAAQCGS